MYHSVSTYVFKERTPGVVYTYVHSIRKTVLNYGRVVTDTAKDSLESIACDCEGSTWRNEKLGHVCTGDLSIVKATRLRELLEKGPKYRERRAGKLERDRERSDSNNR